MHRVKKEVWKGKTGQTRSVGLVAAEVTEAHMSRTSGLRKDGSYKQIQALS